MFKKILIANDGSEGAFKALVAALRLAHSHKAEAHMICVEEIPWMHAGSRESSARKRWLIANSRTWWQRRRPKQSITA
jgi:nucleotide-binding universal stress UspA family protein